MAEQLVEGVGDEVVLFGAFICLAMCMLVYFSLRGGPNRASEGQGNRQQEDGEVAIWMHSL